MTRDPRQMSELGPLLERFLAESGALPRIRQWQAAAHFDEAAGERLASGAKTVRVEDGVLWVQVKGPQWATELSLRKKEIIDRLNDLAGESVLTDIRAVGAWGRSRKR